MTGRGAFGYGWMGAYMGEYRGRGKGFGEDIRLPVITRGQMVRPMCRNASEFVAKGGCGVSGGNGGIGLLVYLGMGARWRQVAWGRAEEEPQRSGCRPHLVGGPEVRKGGWALGECGETRGYPKGWAGVIACFIKGGSGVEELAENSGTSVARRRPSGESPPPVVLGHQNVKLGRYIIRVVVRLQGVFRVPPRTIGLSSKAGRVMRARRTNVAPSLGDYGNPWAGFWALVP